MTTNWLVCIDETPSGTFAFESLHKMAREGDQIFVLHVTGKSMANMFESSEKVDTRLEEEIKKVLTFYGRRAQEYQLKVTLLGSVAGPVNKRIMAAVKDLKIHHLILGKRPQSWLRSLTSSSTTKEVLENAECNVTVAKQTPGSTVSVPDEKSFRAILDGQKISSLRKSDHVFGKEKSRFVGYFISDEGEEMKKSDGQHEGVRMTESPRETERPLERKRSGKEGMTAVEGRAERKIGEEVGRTEAKADRVDQPTVLDPAQV